MRYTAIAHLTNGQVAKWSGECTMFTEPLHDLHPLQRQDIKTLQLIWHNDFEYPNPANKLPCEQRLTTTEVTTVDRSKVAGLVGFTESDNAQTFVWADGIVTKKLATGRKIQFTAPLLKNAKPMDNNTRTAALYALEFDF